MTTDRSRLRTRLLIAGVLPALLAAGFAAKTTHLLHHARQGTSALQAADPDRARDAYAAAGVVNVLEPWIAPYNEGIAAYFQTDGSDGAAEAVTLFEAALALAPSQEQCRVRHNLALAIEAEGDAEPASDLARAREQWYDARATLRVCLPGAADSTAPPTAEHAAMTTAEAAAIADVDRELARKLTEVEEALATAADPPFKGRDADFDDLTPRQQEELLERRNEEAQRVREQDRARKGPVDLSDIISGPTEPEPETQPSDGPVYNW